MLYKLLKPVFFQLDPEKAHSIALKSLQFLYRLKLTSFFSSPPPLPVKVMGLNFPNPVGLAAGLDKNGDYIDALASLGFGFIEVGTITPRPQEGNPRPRLFRLAREEAIINRLGFNNKGVDYLVDRLRKKHFRGILGVNLGKNKETPLEKAAEDYIYSFRRVAPYASYITINISSPNTPELRKLQQGDLMRDLLRALKKEQILYFETSKRYLPLVVKIAPDLNSDELKQIAETLLAEEIDGVIATNTTIRRDSIEHLPQANEAGGLSGKPLSSLSTSVIQSLHSLLQNKIPIIASGGLVSEKAALEKQTAGARLFQLYSGLIYQGPGLIKVLIQGLKSRRVSLHCKDRRE